MYNSWYYKCTVSNSSSKNQSCKNKISRSMTTEPSRRGVKSIQVSGVSTDPMKIKVRVFGPNYRVRISIRGWMMHETGGVAIRSRL